MLKTGGNGSLKADPQTTAIRDLLKVHASEYCQDLDFGAARFCENYNRALGIMAEPPAFEIKDEPQVHLDEDIIAYHVCTSGPPPPFSLLPYTPRLGNPSGAPQNTTE